MLTPEQILLCVQAGFFQPVSSDRSRNRQRPVRFRSCFLLEKEYWQRAEAKRKATMSLRNLAIEKFKTVYKDEPVKPVKTATTNKKSDTSNKK